MVNDRTVIVKCLTIMTKNPIILDKETLYPLIAELLKSGESPSKFYKRIGLSEHQYYSWRRRYLKDHPDAWPPKPKTKRPQVGFHPIKVFPPMPPVRKEQNQQIELEYPNGVILRTGALLSDVRIASLIKLY
jgi:transposase-like protein